MVTVDESAKYENVFVEGLPYRRKVEADDKPLSGKEADAEEKRYEKAVRERRSMTTEQRRMTLHKSRHFSLPICCLANLFSNHITGYEQIDGRNMVVIESVPRVGANPSNEDERSALAWKQKSWIDLDDAMFARIEAESLTDRNHMEKGMTIRLDFERLLDTRPGNTRDVRAVWLLRNSSSQFRFKVLWIGATGTTEQIWSNFKRFHVDIRLLEDTIAPIDDVSDKP